MVDYSNIPRDSRRVPIATKVQFKFDRFSGFISEYSANISPTGMFIVTERPEAPGEILDLEFRLGDGFEIIKGQGEVVWVRSLAEGPSRPPGMGIRFLALSPGCQDLIYRIVDRYVAQGGTPFDLAGAPTRPGGPSSGPEEAPSSVLAPVAAAAPEPPPLAREPDPFPELEGAAKDVAVLPWASSQKETSMPGGDVLPPLEPLDEIFHLEEAPPAVPSAGPAASGAQSVLPFPSAAGTRPLSEPDPFPPLDPDLDLSQAGPTVVGFDEPLPDPPSYPESRSELPGAKDLFASYLPQPASPPETPHVRPLSTLAGGASVHQPRRLLPLVAVVAAVLAVAVAGFLLRSRVVEWTGFGGEEVSAAEQAPVLPRSAVPPDDPTLREEMGGLTSDLAGSRETPTSASSGSPDEPPSAQAPDETESRPLPEVVRRKPAPAPSAGPAATVVERITFEKVPGGTTVVVWGNGALRPESYKRVSVDSPPREVIQIRGIEQPFSPVRIVVGTPEVKQIRIGYHEKPGGNELHVVVDLAGPQVRVDRIEPDGQRLRLRLQER